MNETQTINKMKHNAYQGPKLPRRTRLYFHLSITQPSQTSHSRTSSQEGIAPRRTGPPSTARPRTASRRRRTRSPRRRSESIGSSHCTARGRRTARSRPFDRATCRRRWWARGWPAGPTSTRTSARCTTYGASANFSHHHSPNFIRHRGT